MIQSRTLHGCTVLEHNGRTIVLVAGGWNPNLDTTEYLDLSQDDPIWVSGPVLPTKMEELVLTYTDVGVLLIGGFDSTSIQDSDLIYRLVCNTDVISECTWQEFEHLAKAQSSPVVIPIPNSVDLCQNAITTTPEPLSSSTSSTTSTPLPAVNARVGIESLWGNLLNLLACRTTSTPAPTVPTVPTVPTINVPSIPPEDCSSCPECARIEVESEQISGHASFATIDKVM